MIYQIGECDCCGDQMITKDGNVAGRWMCDSCKRRQTMSVWFVVVVLLVLATIATVFSR